MTREEAIEHLRNMAEHSYPNEEYLMAIEALELVTSYEGTINKLTEALNQQTCEDAVSRQAVLEQTYLWSKDEFLRVTNPFDYLRKRINSLLPVNPQEKTGHWIVWDTSSYDWTYKCDKCGHISLKQSNYCPNCGARMVEPQESEGQYMAGECTYRDTGCGSCKRQLDCPIKSDRAESEVE